jgi:hypothetical protein
MGKQSKLPVRKTKAALRNELETLLPEALTAEEIVQALAAALLTLKQGDRDRLIERLGPETGATLKKVLENARSEQKVREGLAGNAKVLQEWARAWSDWSERISAAGMENGPYLCQEHHWEEPYFDPSALAGDLEPIARRIRKLVPRVIKGGLAPDFDMAEAFVDDIEEIASSLPEWVLFEDFEFEPEATRCLLDWAWLAACRDGKDPYELVLAIRAAEHGCSQLALDAEALISFVDQMKDSEQQLILEGIARDRGRPEWSHVLGMTHLPWFRIFQDLSRRWKPETYIESCRQNISRDWTLALPVIRELARKKDYEGAVAMAEEAARSLLRLREDESWDPRESLLIRKTSPWHDEERKSDITGLLREWLKAAEALGQGDLASALRVQVTIYKREKDWDAAIEELKKIRSPHLVNLRDRLYLEWRDRLAEESVQVGFREGNGHPATWVQGLIDAVWEGRNASRSFRRFIEEWLTEAERSLEALKRARQAAAILTLDLGPEGKLRRTHPHLHPVLSEPQEARRLMQAPRHAWLRRLEASALLPKLMAFWKRNAARLVPDPANCPAGYGHAADWLAAVKELDREEFTRILADWRVKHRRRRNLWKEVSGRGL